MSKFFCTLYHSDLDALNIGMAFYETFYQVITLQANQPYLL